MNALQHTTQEVKDLLDIVATSLYKDSFEILVDKSSCFIKVIYKKSEVSDLTYKEYSSMKSSFKDILEKKGWILLEDTTSEMSVVSERVLELSNLVDKGNITIVRTDQEEEHLESLLLVDSFEEASKAWHKLTGGEILDYREDSEYTNVNCQRDPDFFEDVTEMEL